jgi:hypothetical protein
MGVAIGTDIGLAHREVGVLVELGRNLRHASKTARADRDETVPRAGDQTEICCLSSG